MISPMATQLTHPDFFLPSYKLFFTASPEPRLCQFRLFYGRSLLAAVCASSPNKTSVRVACRKQARTNADLCNDLRKFISVVGLPSGHVPSLKELSQHGRQDLANIVRRRGYKLIRELLAASQEIKVTDSDVDWSLIEDRVCTEEDELIGLDENGKELAEDVSLTSEAVIGETSSTKTSDYNIKSDAESSFLVDGSTEPSLQEKVVKFIQSGELEAIEDDGFDVVNVKEISVSHDSTDPQLSLANEEPRGQVLSVSDSPNSANGSILTSQLVNSTSPLRTMSSNDQLAIDESANTDRDVEVEIKTKEDQAEINRIKVMLHHKELELSQLKEQIEKNKQALSELQAKAEIEISKAQQLLLDKDAELQAAEDSLSGLKQVQVEYWGDGDIVEVAGSFNGWHHSVKLDPQPSSNITDPVELRNTRLWRSMLWLYPGIYEIKFIVDGKWMVDPMKEVVARGSIHNNVLRVDR